MLRDEAGRAETAGRHVGQRSRSKEAIIQYRVRRRKLQFRKESAGADYLHTYLSTPLLVISIAFLVLGQLLAEHAFAAALHLRPGAVLTEKFRNIILIGIKVCYYQQLITGLRQDGQQ